MKPKTIAKRIAKDIISDGGEAWYVGGYVRDRLLGIEPYDIDIEVYGLPEDKLAQILRKHKAKKVGQFFPVWTIGDVDISLPRTEKGDGVHHNVVNHLSFNPGLDKMTAMARRDFTINTFMRDAATGRLIFCEGAKDDLEHKVIRAQNEHFPEDPLRVFRAARFAAQLGFTIDGDTLEACRAIDTSNISQERINVETYKAIRSDNPSAYFRYLLMMGKLEQHFPELFACVGVEQPSDYHPEGDVFEHTMLALDYAAKRKMGYDIRLAVLCHDLGKPLTAGVIDGKLKFLGHGPAGRKPAEDLMKRLEVPKSLVNILLPMVEHHMEIYELESRNASIKSYNKFFDKIKYPYTFLLVSECDRNGKGLLPSTSLPKIDFDRLEQWDFWSEFRKYEEVTGEDLIAAGHAPSLAFKPALELAHKLWVSRMPKKDALPNVLGVLRKEERKKGG